MKTPRLFSRLALALFLSLLNPKVSLVSAQGSLTPPGTPAPTMKTLDQVEPRKEVNATNTPGNAQNLFVISTPGSYYLSGDITGVSGKNGIFIIGADVSLDLNGFVLTGVPGSLDGITLGGRNLTIRNGTIREWGSSGLDCGFAIYALFEDLRVFKNGSDGLHAGGGSIVRGCTASFNGQSGFSITRITSSTGEDAQDAVFENCFATFNGGNGFTFLQGAVITNCEARFNSGNGINAVTGITITNCLAAANLGDGINAGAGSTLTNCTAKENLGTNGIFAGEGSTLNNCTAYSNNVEFGILAGDKSTLTNCSASLNNSAATESRGISAGAQCTISNCTASENLNTNGTPSGATGGGIRAGTGSSVKDCTVSANKGDGIQIAADSVVAGNTCDSNGAGVGDGAGIHSTSTDNRIEGNNVTDNSRGIDVDAAGSLIIKNSASGNSFNYVIAADNNYGTILDLTGAATAAVNGSSAAGTLTTTTNPWANFSY